MTLNTKKPESGKSQAPSPRYEYPIIGAICFVLIVLFAYAAAAGYLTSPATPPQQQDTADRPQGDGAQPQDNPPQRPLPIEGTVTVVDQESAEQKATRAEEQANRRKEIWIELGTLIAASLAACAAFGAWRANRREAAAAEDQLAAIREELSVKLSIERVLVDNLQAGLTPIAFIEIRNSGALDAINVAIDIKVEIRSDVTFYGNSPHKITIPAHGVRGHFIKSQHLMSEQTLAMMNADDSFMRITGFIEYAGERNAFCYKFNRNPWDIPWLPRWIPCEFDLRRTVTASTAASAGFKFTVKADLTAGPSSSDNKEKPEEGQRDG